MSFISILAPETSLNRPLTDLNSFYLKDSLVITFVSLFFMAAWVYLPDHLASIYGHIHYYLTADKSMIQDYIPSASSILQGGGPATGALNVVYETISGAATTATLGEL